MTRLYCGWMVVVLVEQSAYTAMLCSVSHIALYFVHKVIVIHILNFAEYLFVEAALPPGAEDEVVLIEHLPGRRVHLQDFFWTGAEDAPPWMDPDQTLTFYETRTIHHTATIYVPGESPEQPGNVPSGGPQDPGCVNCIEPTATLGDADQDIGILVGDDPGPRYWLLTVLRSGEDVPPKVELKLARLYRAAFARQQQRHLGLLSTDPRLRRATKRRLTAESQNKAIARNPNESATVLTPTTIENPSSPTESSADNNSINIHEPNIPKNGIKRMREVKILNDQISKEAIENPPPPIDQTTETPTNSPLQFSSEYEPEPQFSESTLTENPESTETPETLQDNVPSSSEDPKSTDTPLDSSSAKIHESSTKIAGIPQYLMSQNSPKFYPDEEDYSNSNKETTIKNPDGQSPDEPRENNTEAVNASQQANNSTNSRLRTAGIGMVQVRMQNTTVLEDGATRLIYSVHLGGKPVPAETAAKDMALLSPQEVALELGAPVIIQSEPYLKETRPLALSRKRDAWLLAGAASVALILLLVLAGVIVALKQRKGQSAVSANSPPMQSILKKERGGYTPTTPGLDNTGYTSETEGRTEGTSQRQTLGSISRSPGTPLTPDTLDDDIHELSSDNNDDKDEEEAKKKVNEHWDIEEYPLSGKKSRAGKRRMARTNAIETPASLDSMETVVDRQEHRDSLENGCIHVLEETASPHSYLSMPSCKVFPNMQSVEPLSRILEPVVVRHLDMESETPEVSRRTIGFSHRDTGDELLARTRSAFKDPGAVGPIVWDLRRQRAVEESLTSETDIERQPPSSGAVGRARRRLHELLEDSFSLFSTRDIKQKDTIQVSSTLRPSSAAISNDRVTINSDSRGKSANVTPVGSPVNYTKGRPRTSLPRNGMDEIIPETGNTARQPRGAWGSRPMSAGPFHRPNLPEVDVTRVLADHQLTSEDPAVPLIAAIRKELEKFTPEKV